MPATLATAAIALSACGPTGTTSVPHDLTGKSATAILADAKAAAIESGWVRIDVVGNLGGATQTESILAGKTTGSQTLNAGASQSMLRLIGPTLYVIGNEAYLKSTFAVPNGQWAGTWISITSDHVEYEPLASTMRIQDAITPQSSVSNQKIVGTVHYKGLRAVEIEGSTTNAAGTIKIATYLAYASPHLPIAEVASGTTNGQKVSLVASYTRWGIPFVIVPPRTSTPITSTNLK
jgi:hypothetical protein